MTTMWVVIGMVALVIGAHMVSANWRDRMTDLWPFPALMFILSALSFVQAILGRTDAP